MTTRTPTQLTGAEQAIWDSYLRATRLLFDELDSRLLDEAGLSLPDFIVLFRLRNAGDEGLRMSDLADSAVFSRSRLSHAVSRMEKEGWVERRSCPTDRRGSFAALTASGRSKLDSAEATHVEVIRQHLLDHVEASSDFHSATDAIGASFKADPDSLAC